jgi:hypothetical protein
MQIQNNNFVLMPLFKQKDICPGFSGAGLHLHVGRSVIIDRRLMITFIEKDNNIFSFRADLFKEPPRKEGDQFKGHISLTIPFALHADHTREFKNLFRLTAIPLPGAGQSVMLIIDRPNSDIVTDKNYKNDPVSL